MPSDNPATTDEFDERRAWVARVLGYQLTAGEQAEAVAAEVLVSRYEQFDAAQDGLVAALRKLPAWPEGVLLAKQAAAGDTALAKLKADLTATDAAVLAQGADIKRRLDKMEIWQHSTAGAIAVVVQDQETLRAEAAGLRTQIAGTAGPHTGEIRKQLDAIGAGLETAAAAIEAGGIEGGRVGVDEARRLLGEAQADIARRFDEAEKALSVQIARLASLLPDEHEFPDVLSKLRQDGLDALVGSRLGEAEAATNALTDRMDTIARDRFAAGAIEQRYLKLKPVLEKIVALKGSDFSLPDSAKKVAAIQERIAEELETFFPDEYGWLGLKDSVESLEKKLAQANGLFEKDTKARAAVAAAASKAAQDAADALALAKQQQAAAQQQAIDDFNANVAQAKLEGDAAFAGSDLVKRVWAKTRQDAPHSANTGIAGSYRYAVIMAAIAEWNHMTLAGGFVAVHVPGGGNPEDKRPKGRNEVQADFISDWGTNGRVNVHVNVAAQDWELV